MEHAAAHTKEGQPKPVLGKQQFETVAKGSKEFDHYLRKTLQGGDDEIAIRDQWRDDHYHDAHVTQLSPPKPPPKASSSRAGRPMVTDSESGDSDDSETEDEDDDDVNMKATTINSSNLEAEVDVGKEGTTSAQFEEFLRYKAFMEQRQTT